ncbi:unnamed protein product, partial [Arctogadus glacialis]
NEETGVMDSLLEALQSGAAFRDRRRRAPRPRDQKIISPGSFRQVLRPVQPGNNENIRPAVQGFISPLSRGPGGPGTRGPPTRGPCKTTTTHMERDRPTERERPVERERPAERDRAAERERKVERERAAEREGAGERDRAAERERLVERHRPAERERPRERDNQREWLGERGRMAERHRPADREMESKTESNIVVESLATGCKQSPSSSSLKGDSDVDALLARLRAL